MPDDEPLWLPEEQAPADVAADPHFQEVGVIDGAPLQPVRPPRQRPRWLVPAVAAIVLVLVATVGGAWALAVLTAVDPARAGYAYVPADSALVVELRLDLPAGQEEELGTFLPRFPGFGNAATVQRLLVERLDELVTGATDGRINYEDDIQSFFSGWVVAAMPAPTSDTSQAMPVPLVVAGVSDRVAAEATLRKLREPGSDWASTDVLGVPVWSGEGGAYAVTDDALVIGQAVSDVERALRTHAEERDSLLDETVFTDALKRAPAGRLAMAWVDVPAASGTSGLPLAMPELTPACAALVSGTPTDAIAVLYLRDGKAVVDISYNRAAGGPALEVGASSLDDHVPADAFLYAEKKSVGAGAADLLACLRSQPEASGALAEVEESLGPLDALVGWLGDSAVALRYDGTKLTGGLLVEVTDELKASETLGQLRAALTAMGNDAGEVTVSEDTYRDARIVTFQFSGAGLSSLPPIMPATSLAYALKDGLLVIGVDASFARAVLDTEASASLAAADRYRRVTDGGGGQNAGIAFVDLVRALEVMGAIGGDEPGGGDGLGSMRLFTASLEAASVVVLADQATVTMRLTLSTTGDLSP